VVLDGGSAGYKKFADKVKVSWLLLCFLGTSRLSIVAGVDSQQQQ
jgi:hypothetical protein